jgi:putative NIF3 family GTP cyclohydrolase 1 type 2
MIFACKRKNASRWNTTFSFTGKQIKKVAVLGGSGSYAIKMQLWLVLMLLTADLKYHQFYEAEKAPLADIGHFESERYTKLYC